jgi:hypothetical protein
MRLADDGAHQRPAPSDAFDPGAHREIRTRRLRHVVSALLGRPSAAPASG